MVERRRSSSGRNVRVHTCGAETDGELAVVAKDGERERVSGKKVGRSRTVARRHPVVERLCEEQDEVYVKEMEDKNLEYRKRTMLELFGDDTLPESDIEEVEDDTSLHCDTSSIERKLVGEHGCTTCGDIGPEEEVIIRCDGCSNRWRHRYSDVSSEDSSRPQAGEWGGAQQHQSQQQQSQQPQAAVTRASLDLHEMPNNKPPDFLASKCSGMNGLDLLLEVARSVSECGEFRDPAGLFPLCSQEAATTANTSGLSTAWTQSPRRRGGAGHSRLPAETAPRNGVAPSALATSSMRPQASRSSSSTVSGHKRKALAVGTSTSSPTSTSAQQWPSSAEKGNALNNGYCDETPALVPWERIKAGNRRYRLLSSMLC